MELCGTFSRDPINPRLGPITYGVRPVTTVEKIERFLSAATRLRGHDQAERVLRVVRDNAWSPMETVIATMAMSRERLATEALGYEFVGETNNVDVHIAHLRARIDDRFGIKLITTVRGVGYVIREA